MADQQTVSDSMYRVALDLMKEIARAEMDGEGFKKPDPRTYYLKLYSQCRKVVVSSTSAEDALRK